ncbi:MAG: DUF4019 domain-containing protein [Pyrinomonadaceae bacterium]
MTKENCSALVLMVVLCFTAVACQHPDTGKATADAAIAQFHALLDEERYAEIYAASHQRMKEAATEEGLTKTLQSVHIKLGKVKETVTQSFNEGNYNLKGGVNVFQRTTFERGKATERFVWAIDGQNAVLIGYRVDTMELDKP